VADAAAALTAAGSAAADCGGGEEDGRSISSCRFVAHCASSSRPPILPLCDALSDETKGATATAIRWRRQTTRRMQSKPSRTGRAGQMQLQSSAVRCVAVHSCTPLQWSGGGREGIGLAGRLVAQQRADRSAAPFTRDDRHRVDGAHAQTEGGGVQLRVLQCTRLDSMEEDRRCSLTVHSCAHLSRIAS
jgi:hypothetical protein